MADDFVITDVTPAQPAGSTQMFTFKIVTTGDFKGTVLLGYQISDRVGTTSDVASVDVPESVFLYYNDTEYISAAVTNVPVNNEFGLTVTGTHPNTPPSPSHSATGIGHGKD